MRADMYLRVAEKRGLPVGSSRAVDHERESATGVRCIGKRLSAMETREAGRFHRRAIEQKWPRSRRCFAHSPITQV